MVNSSDHPPEAILNDFDLAATMRPGSTSPKQPGFEQVGTMPFVGIDMFFAARRLNRGFRHDLESALWSALWYCDEQPEWLNPSFGLLDISEAKIKWIHLINSDRTPSDAIRPGSEQLWGRVIDAIWDWTQAYMQSERDLEPKTDQEWLAIVHRHLPCPEEIGTEWMNYRVSSRIRATDRTRNP
jgi:Fungal protein kinase